jgi:hypothetical protein
MKLDLTELEAKSLLSLLNRLWNMGSYDYIFPTEADEKRASKLTKQLEKEISLGQSSKK